MMRARAGVVLGAVVGLLGPINAQEAAPAPPSVAAYAVLTSPCDSGAVARVAQSMGAVVTRYSCAVTGTMAFRFPLDTVSATNVLARLRSARRADSSFAVLVAEFDETTEPPASTGTDGLLPSWGLDSMRVAGAWSQGVTGEGVTVGVIDTGFDPRHPEFSGRIDWAGTTAGSGVDSSAGASLQVTAACKHHGSHVAGTTLGAMRGMAPGARLAFVRVGVELSGRCVAWTSAQVAALQFLSARGVRVVGTSMGGSWSGAYQAVVNQARLGGVVLVAAAGNNDSYVYCPACYSDAIAVAGLTSSLSRASYSNRGPELNFAAPGSSISAAVGASGFQSKSGTSMAQPHIAGLVAMLLSADPTLTPSAIDTLLRECSLDLSTPGFDESTGWGMPRADRCIALALGEELQPTTASTPVLVGPVFPVEGCRAVSSPALWTVGDAPAWLALTVTPTQICYRIDSDPGLDVPIDIRLIGVP